MVLLLEHMVLLLEHMVQAQVHNRVLEQELERNMLAQVHSNGQPDVLSSEQTIRRRSDGVHVR